MSHDARRRDIEYAPAPFTAEEIRAANGPGRVLRHRIEAPGRPTVIQEFRWIEADDDWGTREGRVFDEAGAPKGEPKRSRTAWLELQAHASFPAAKTSIEETTVELPAGTFDCALYTVTEGATVRKFWFAKALPGMPAKMEIRDGEELRMRMELVEVRQDSPSAAS